MRMDNDKDGCSQRSSSLGRSSQFCLNNDSYCWVASIGNATLPAIQFANNTSELQWPALHNWSSFAISLAFHVFLQKLRSFMNTMAGYGGRGSDGSRYFVELPCVVTASPANSLIDPEIVENCFKKSPFLVQSTRTRLSYRSCHVGVIEKEPIDRIFKNMVENS